MASKFSGFEPLLYAASTHSSEMLYFGRFFAPDPFVAFGVGRKKIALLNALEFDRGLKESSFDKIESLEAWIEYIKSSSRKAKVGVADVIAALAATYKIKGFWIPYDFPYGLALALRKRRIQLEVRPAPFFPQQMIKQEEELRALRVANKVAAKGILAVEAALKKAEIRSGKKLFLQGRVLTSEYLRFLVEMTCLEHGAQAECIVAAGEQACDPHSIGNGPICADQLIIVDVFPRMKATGYYGDMTRTFLKGKASEAQKQLMSTVRSAQKKAISSLKRGVSGKTVHEGVVNYFKEKGYLTDFHNKPAKGFIHSTGHGLGLGLHEPLRLSAQSETLLSPGMVVTIEPGLYYPGLGAVRIEDVFTITDNACEGLSSLHYKWQVE